MELDGSVDDIDVSGKGRKEQRTSSSSNPEVKDHVAEFQALVGPGYLGASTYVADPRPIADRRRFASDGRFDNHTSVGDHQHIADRQHIADPQQVAGNPHIDDHLHVGDSDHAIHSKHKIKMDPGHVPLRLPTILQLEPPFPPPNFPPPPPPRHHPRAQNLKGAKPPHHEQAALPRSKSTTNLRRLSEGLAGGGIFSPEEMTTSTLTEDVVPREPLTAATVRFPFLRDDDSVVESSVYSLSTQSEAELLAGPVTNNEDGPKSLTVANQEMADLGQEASISEQSETMDAQGSDYYSKFFFSSEHRWRNRSDREQTAARSTRSTRSTRTSSRDKRTRPIWSALLRKFILVWKHFLLSPPKSFFHFVS